jgi:hypothetical protein
MASYSGSKTFIQKYNDVDHEIDMYLDNSGNVTSSSDDYRYYINPASVLSFIIEENFVTWDTGGYILLAYMPDDPPAEAIGGQTSFVSSAQQNAETLRTYHFRGDGFDTLRVCITPKLKDGSDSSGGYLKVEPYDPKWTLSYLFSVTEIEDVNDVPGLKGPIASYVKCVKLFLSDLRTQIIKTANLEYSTSLSQEANTGSGLANGYSPQGTLKTGKILNEIFNQALTDQDLGGSSDYQVSDDSETWDEGISDLFYTSPAQWFASDDIQYVHGQHVSSKDIGNGLYDISFLTSKRADDGKQISNICLLPISKFFEKAGTGEYSPGEDQIEHFFVTSHSSEDNNTGKKLFAPFSENSSDRDLKTNKYGQIISYSFVDMSPNMNAVYFSNTPVYSVDVKTRTFQTKFEDNTVEKARDLIGETYIEKLYKGSGDAATELFIPTLHSHKKENKNVYPTFSLNHDQVDSAEKLRQKNGIGQLLYTGLFQNTCICFSTFGLSHREPGKIIGIDKMLPGQDVTDHTVKLFGQWFIVKVVHSFETGAYMNLIYAIKLHRFKPAKLKFPNTI